MIKGFLPNNNKEIKKLGWKQVDIIIVTGDAYIDHPSFEVATCGKYLDKHGFNVAILDMPNIDKNEEWTIFGKPKLFFLVITGAEDSMVSNFTPYLKLKTSDQYLPGNKKINRPDRALIRYCNKIKELYKSSKIVIGGVEAAGRMASHYDFWTEKIRKPILFDTKADILLYGSMELNLLKIAEQLKTSRETINLNSLTGVAHIANEISERMKHTALPSFEDIKDNKDNFLEHERILHSNQNPYNSELLVQKVLNRYLIINKPNLPMEKDEIDPIYSSNFTLKPHPKYKEEIPAFNRIKDQIHTHRGTLDALSFTQDIFTQGRLISFRSKSSILKNIINFSRTAVFNKIVRNFFGIRSNYYGIKIRDEEKCSKCERISCIAPDICKNLSKGTRAMIEVSKEVDEVKNVRNNFYASEMDIRLTLDDTDAFKEYIMKRVGTVGILAYFSKNDFLNNMMGLPEYRDIKIFIDEFIKRTGEYSKKYDLVLNVIAGYPGEVYENVVDNILEIIKLNLSTNQIIPFIPLPMTIAACQYYTGKDPFDRGDVVVSNKLSEKKNIVAIYNHKNKSNYKTIHRILHEIGRKKDINIILKNKG